MAISFARAPRVQPGERMTDAHLAGLANAFRGRQRSGIGDPSFRISYYILSGFRSLLAGRPSAAYFEHHQTKAEAEDFPEVAEPDTDGGVNRGSLAGAYVFGDGHTLLTEAGRINMPLTPAGVTLGDYWQLGKDQRGGWDPATGATAAPAFDAARSYAAIRFSTRSPIGVAYGGFLPTPALLGTACEDPDTDDEYGPPLNYEIKFASLRAGVADKVYPGTCQDGPDLSTPGMYDSHVYAIGYTPFAYYVVLNDGTIEELPTTDWLEGPYDGAPALYRTPGGHIERAFNRFSADFRGADQASKAMSTEIPAAPNARAFDYHRFLSSQYLLAPSVGTEAADSVDVTYPQRVAGSLRQQQSIEPFVAASEDSAIAMVYVKVSGLVGSAAFECVVDGEVVSTFSVPAPGGEAIHVLRPAVPQVTIRAARAVSCQTLLVEAADLMAYRPGMHDLFLVLRLSQVQ